MTTDKPKAEKSTADHATHIVVEVTDDVSQTLEEIIDKIGALTSLNPSNKPRPVVKISAQRRELRPPAVLFGTSRRKRRSPPLRQLVRLADFLPLTSRKQVKAMAGDYYAEIIRLRRERRYKAARWNEVLAWCYTAWYVLRGPVDQLVSAAMKAVKGS